MGASRRDFHDFRKDGRQEAHALRRLVVPDNPALVTQIIALEAELSSLELEISRLESETNALINSLYGLSEREALVVAKG